MRFPDPVALTCAECGQPTVVAETALGAVRVHCGTWRWQCDPVPGRGQVMTLPDRVVPGPGGDQHLAA